LVTILTNRDVERLVSMREAIAALEQALRHKGSGEFVAPPRHYVANKRGALAFTIGGDAAEGVIGFRAYGMFPGSSEDEQLVVVYDAASGALRGIVVGERIGAMRTGALGGIAVRHGSREDSSTVAMIGSGRQARTQLEAAVCVRDLSEVRVYSRSEQNRERFAKEMSEEVGVRVSAVATAGDAIAGADIVIVATSGREPVFDTSLIEAGQHVTTMRLGEGQHDLDKRVADRAVAIFTDSLDQLRRYPGGFFLADRIESITDLSEHVTSMSSVRRSRDDITLYLSTGLAGTEVVVADLALRKAQATNT
jgi:ornithine cyclodeaminase/alanine dehydrogenase-like protein (mu-crystallin family)